MNLKVFTALKEVPQKCRGNKESVTGVAVRG